MELIKLHPDVILPERGSDGAAGYDIFMPSAGEIKERTSWASPASVMVGLRFAMKVPVGCVALIVPRSGAGAKHGIALRNTVGVIDSDYEGEWKVAVTQKEGKGFSWAAGERLFQFVIVPCLTPEIKVVEQFSEASERGQGGFGSTGA